MRAVRVRPGLNFLRRVFQEAMSELKRVRANELNLRVGAPACSTRGVLAVGRARAACLSVALPFGRSLHPTAPMMGSNLAIGPAQREAPFLARSITSLGDDELDGLDAYDSDGGSGVMGFAGTKKM